MTKLHIQTLGELSVSRDGELQSLPASKKTRALLAYLALTARPQRRDRLCEMFWEVPDDPRGALRWSLSKLRPVVNDGDSKRLAADRERVSFRDNSDVVIDIHHTAQQLNNPNLTVEELQAIAVKLRQPLLDGIDLPNQELFQQWLTAERQETNKLAASIAQRLSAYPGLPPDQTLPWSRAWLKADPFSTKAASRLLTQLWQLGKDIEAATLTSELNTRFRNAGIDWCPKAANKPHDNQPQAADASVTRQLLERQTIQFCSAADDVRIAYGCVGEGPPLVKAANWLSHLELDWDAPIWSPLFRQLAQDHLFVRYDERGNGLSDWDVRDISFDAFVTDLETVVDALELDKFALLGISQGASVSIEYAVRHPEKVSHLILFGSYAAGWRIDASPEIIKEREAVVTLTETGWGQDNPAYRQIFSSTFMPSASPEELGWFNEFQRRTTSPENAARFLTAFGDIDVRQQLANVTAPTLVMHSMDDQRILLDVGRDVAASIPNAEFVSLDSDSHLLLGREPASQDFIATVKRFIET